MSRGSVRLRFPLQSPDQAGGLESFSKKTFSDGSSLEDGKIKLEMSADGGLFFDVILPFGGGVLSSLAAQWLYQRFGNSNRRVIICEREITYETEDEFIRVIEREIQEVDA